MPIVTDQAQMEAAIKSRFLELYADMPDAIYGMLHPRLVCCNFEQRSMEAVIQTQPWMRNVNHVVHGGIIATILDSIGGSTLYCFTPVGSTAPTVSLQISYLKPVPLDMPLHVRGTITQAGKNLLYVRTEAFHPDDPTHVYATGSGVHFIQSMKGAANHG